MACIKHNVVTGVFFGIIIFFAGQSYASTITMQAGIKTRSSLTVKQITSAEQQTTSPHLQFRAYGEKNSSLSVTFSSSDKNKFFTPSFNDKGILDFSIDMKDMANQSNINYISIDYQ